MKKNDIPLEIQSLSREIIDRFNRANPKNTCEYLPRFRGAFLYLDRADNRGAPTQICRLQYTGSIDKWEFAIFKYSSDRYDPDEFMFPGASLLDGSIEGAMRCGMEAYPV